MATFLLIIIYLAFISLGLPDSLLGAAWPVMQGDLGAPLETAGLLFMTIACGTIISSLISGRILKRYGTGKVTFVSVLMTAVALLGFHFAPSIVWLMVCAVPLGLGAGAVDTGLNDYVAVNYKARHMSWLHCFWGVGATLGPIIMAQFILGDSSSSWRNGYFLIA
ncbi:MFS transporter, partial [Psychrobacillus psychrotolerans]|uniref:MFS transporter n=2 Tax=Psychrobacillus TaxID=1221880 RepID=UPI003C731037